MSNKNEKTAAAVKQVVPALAQFVGNHYQENDLQELLPNLQELFEIFCEHEVADELYLREKFLQCIRLARSLKETLAPFTQEQIILACEAHGYHSGIVEFGENGIKFKGNYMDEALNIEVK